MSIPAEQFWKLYEKLPQELKDALWAEETGDSLSEICRKYEIGENLEQIVDLTGRVLVGVLALDDFQEALEKELGIKKDAAKKVSREIYRFIFYPVKTSLEEMYKPAEKIEVVPIVPKIKPETKPPESEKKIEKQDTYREQI